MYIEEILDEYHTCLYIYPNQFVRFSRETDIFDYYKKGDKEWLELKGTFVRLYLVHNLPTTDA